MLKLQDYELLSLAKIATAATFSLKRTTDWYSIVSECGRVIMAVALHSGLPGPSHLQFREGLKRTSTHGFVLNC